MPVTLSPTILIVKTTKDVGDNFLSRARRGHAPDTRALKRCPTCHSWKRGPGNPWQNSDL
jgi:hypothetical protein